MINSIYYRPQFLSNRNFEIPDFANEPASIRLFVAINLFTPV
jgi:hypothetical protein